MKILVDGVFFQLAKTGIARIWATVLPKLARYPDVQISLLDRGGAPKVPGINTIEFPSYKMDAGTAADSFLIERFAKLVGADVFVSTYYTTPISTPSVLMVYDMIPEVLEFDLGQRPWQEKQLAIDFAMAYACISEQTRRDLERFYPGTLDFASVTYCGVDRAVFQPQSAEEISAFKARHGVATPYFILVGARAQHANYKNAILAFKAAKNLTGELLLLCIGGEPELQRDFLAELPPNVTARHLELTDAELACAYSGAEALVFPSLYEGFGMPVIEAMACRCPVITTNHGSLAEVAGDAAILVAGDSAEELGRAMSEVRLPQVRQKYADLGFQRCTRFDWDNMTRGVHELMKRAIERGNTAQAADFFEKWGALRRIQGAVDPY